MKQSLKTRFKVWDTHYDFSEINKFNYHQVFRTYFNLTTKKITLLAMFLVLVVIFGLISQFVLTLFPPIATFLTFNITIWVIMVAYMAFSFFYSFLLLEISTWLRLAYNPSNLAGIISMNLNDFTFLLFLVLFVHLINYIRFQFQKNYDPKYKRFTYFWVLMIASVLATFITSGLDVGYNYGFMFDLYGILFLGSEAAAALKTPAILIIVFWFNLAQSAINIFLFAAVFRAAYPLINLYIN